jgi:hypothetical protein
MGIAICEMKIRTGTATSNGLGSPPSDPIRGVPISMANKFFLAGSLFREPPSPPLQRAVGLY